MEKSVELVDKWFPDISLGDVSELSDEDVQHIHQFGESFKNVAGFDIHYFIAMIDGVKGMSFILREGEPDDIISFCEKMGIGYGCYRIDCPGEERYPRYIIFMTPSESIFNTMPEMEKEGLTSLGTHEDIGRFLGLSNEEDICWKEDPELYEKSIKDDEFEETISLETKIQRFRWNVEKKLYNIFDNIGFEVTTPKIAKRNLKPKRKSYEEITGYTLSDREYIDRALPSVNFAPTMDGLRRNIVHGREIRASCEEFDKKLGKLWSLDYLSSQFSHKQEVIETYIDNRKKVIDSF